MFGDRHVEEKPGHPPITNAKDWSGLDDPGNPRNFNLSRRVIATTIVALLAFVSTFAASIYSAGIEQVRHEFGISEELATLPLVFFNIGLSLGPLMGAPLCETFGRKVVFLVTSPVFGLFTLGAGFSSNLTALTVCRFLAGVFAAPAIGNASATIIDYTAGKSRATSMAVYYSLPTFGSVFGPLIGGFVVQARGWRWTQFVTVFVLVAFYIPVFTTRESYKKIILQRRAKRLHIEGPPQIERSPIEFARYFATTQLKRPWHMLFTEPIVTLVCTYSGFLFGLTYTFVTASSWVYKHYYGFDVTGQSLSFLGLDVGSALAPLPLILIDQFVCQPRFRRYQRQHPEAERMEPEDRLAPAMIGSCVLPPALFIFAWTARPSVPWIVPIFFQGVAIMASILIYATVNLYNMDTYGPLYGASAAGASMFSRYLFSAVFPLFSLRLFKTLGVGWATSILAFCTVLMAPIPWLFWRYGARLRAKTKYETTS